MDRRGDLPRGARAAPSEPFGLTVAQESVWFLARLDPDDPSHNLAFAVDLAGPLDRAAFRAACGAVLTRHPQLRARLAPDEPGDRDEGARQVVSPDGPALLDEIYREIDCGSPPDEVTRLVAERPFELHGPLVRMVLITDGGARHRLVFVAHQLVFDRRSRAVVLHDLAAAYERARRGAPTCPEPHGPGYRELVAQERETLAATDGALSERWRSHIPDSVSPVALPADRPRPRERAHEGTFVSAHVDHETLRRLADLAADRSSSLFTVCLAALHALLRRYGNEGTFCVNALADARIPGYERLVGMLVHTLPTVVDADLDTPFADLLARTGAAWDDARAGRALPLARIVEAVGLRRHPGIEPLFQVVLDYDDESAGTFRFDGLETTVVPVPNGGARADLVFEVDVHRASQDGAGLEVRLEADRGLFDPATATRMLGHYVALLRAVAHDPDRAVGRFPILDDAERELLVHGWNRTAGEVPRATINELIDAAVARTPDHPAVEHDGEILTYAELDARANRLAHALRARGVGEPDPGRSAASHREDDVPVVGLCTRRGPDLVVGVLGILKAGGAYLPLDPSYPAERLDHFVRDAGVRTLVVQEDLLDRVPHDDLAVVRVDGDAADLDGLPDTPVCRVTAPDDLAYLIYTSGSTGRPKGVMVEHQSVVNLVCWARAAFTDEERRRMLAATSLSFDVSVFEIFTALCWSTTLVVVEDATVLARRDAPDVTLVNAVPSVISAVLAEAHLPGSVRAVVLAGEALTPAVARQCHEGAPAARVVNAYGPTEATVFATASVVARDDAIVTIGTPLTNVTAHVLDRHLQPVPVGVEGELFLGGAGVARGYRDQPGLTGERFVADPFARDRCPGSARLYRTGDRVRRRPDGELEYLGRGDHQIKLHGFRIEPGEIEAVLVGHDRIRQAVVTVREDERGGKRLVAYVVARGTPPTPTELHGYAGELLPAHMVPSVFVLLDAIPLNANGKIDRSALPAPVSDRDARVELVAPRTATERTIAGIWSDLLGLDELGVHDDFFELGGHSLLATRVVSRVAREFDVDLPLRSLFDHRTVAQLAGAVDELVTRDDGADVAPPLVPRRRSAAPELSFAQQRLWFLDRLFPDNPFYNITVAFRLTGAVDVGALERSLAEIVARHESLRTTFAIRDGRPAQVVGPPRFTLELVDLDQIPAAEREGVTAHNLRRRALFPFDLEHGPVLRAVLTRIGSQDHVLGLLIHHVAADGWSLGVMADELGRLYGAFREGRPSPLAPLPLQYADFSEWQRRWLSGRRLDRQLGYWRDRFAHEPPALELPTDRTRPPVPSYRGASRRFRVPQPLTEAVRDCARTHDATLFMTSLAAFKVLLARYTGVDDVVVGSPIAGRTRPELEALVGFFVNTLVLRTDCSGDPSFGELLARVREVCLGAYAHQDLPYERLVEELAPARTINHAPLFQVMFAVQNTPDATPRLDGLTVAPFELDSGIAKADMSLHLVEDEDGMAGELFYATDLFDAATVDRVVEHYLTLLEAAVTDPACPLSELQVLGDKEQYRVVVEWNDTTSPYAETTIPELVAGAACRVPDAPAVVFGEQTLTHRQLDEAANRLAQHLRASGLGRGDVVGLCLDRSADLVVALLGILRSGAAYVPLDPEYPSERIAFMLDDTRAAAVVTRSDLAARLPADRPPTVCLDTERDVIAQRPSVAPPDGPGPDDLAYVLFTSGSTGRPKGVMIEHRGVVNHLASLLRDCELTPDDVVLQLPSISFHPSVRDIFGTLCAGARLVVVDHATARDPAALLDQMSARSVTAFLSGVPSLLVALLDEAERRDRPTGRLRVVVLCGEPLRVHDAQRLVRTFGCRILNHFGPTESIMAATVHWFGEQDEGRPTVLAGRPIGNAEVYVLDANGRPVPIGVTGEVHIGGPGLARGYLNDPELTARRFVAHPFDTSPGARVYRSGDLGRFLPDGTLEFRGRLDDQLKVRGHRVEPREVERVLLDDPAIAAAAAVPVHDEAGGARLVAYVVAGAGGPLSIAELRTRVRSQLPDYMVPSAFVELEELPFLPSGKLDRAALVARTAPEMTRSTLETAFVAPRTELEATLARLYAEVVGVDRVGVHDDFFELGGHSLLAVQLFTRIETELGIRLPLSALFEDATVAGIGVAVERERDRPNAWGSLVPMRTHGSRPPLFVGPGLLGDVLTYRNLVGHLGPEQRVYGLQSLGLDGRVPPQLTVPDMAERYVRELREVQPAGPYFLAGYCFGGVVAIEMANQLEQAGDEVALLALLNHPLVKRRVAPGAAMRRDRARLARMSFRAKVRFVTARLRLVSRIARDWFLATGEQDHAPLWWAVHDLYARIGRPPPPRFRDIVAVNRRAYRSYVPPATRCPITLITCYEDPSEGWFGDPERWRALLAEGEIEQLQSPGATHLTLLDEPHVQEIAAIINRRIAAADGPVSRSRSAAP